MGFILSEEVCKAENTFEHSLPTREALKCPARVELPREGADKKIRGMAQQGLCHPKFSKCVQNKQSDWSDFKGSSKQAI